MKDKSVQGAQDKLAFLLSLVPFLLERGTVTVTEASRQFEVSEAQIRDAVNLIAVSGIPGETRSYQASDLFDIDWDAFELNDEIIITQNVAIDDSPKFSGKEAATLIAGLQYLQSLPESSQVANYSLLMAKLTRGSSGAPAQFAVSTGDANTTLAQIRSAIASDRQIHFDYRGATGPTERRTVDPIRVDSDNEDWYLRGYCHSREAIRTFRLDRISALDVADTAQSHTVLAAGISDRLFDHTTASFPVQLRVRSDSLALLGEYVPIGTKPDPSSEFTIVTVQVAHLHSLKRLIVGLGNVASVISPDSARQEVAAWARAGEAQYEQSEGQL